MKHQTISPVDGRICAEFEWATGPQIENALQQAAAAERLWRNTPLDTRIRLIGTAVDRIVAAASEIGREITLQMGRPIRQSPSEITRGFQERARFLMDGAPAILSDIQPAPKGGFERFIRREPLGTVLVLAPWNYPYLTTVNSLIPALLAGNCVILKMSDQTPLVAERYAAALGDLPQGVFQYLHATHDDVARIIADSRIGAVSFTGSVAGGHAVQQAASTRFIPANLELGGKDPAYVRPDAPLDFTIENLVDGAMFNSGQSCCAIERIYVHRDIYSRFVEGFVAFTRQYRLGNPLEEETNLGPVVRTPSANHVRAQVQEAVARGARTLIDEREFPEAREGSPYLAPQVLTGVTHEMRLMREETFGPAVGIMPVASDEEAIALMNDSDYGLTASVWTADRDAAISIGNQIATGTWFMNRCDYLDPALAWTGVKNSGRGCTLSVLGFEAFTRPKSFHLRVDV